MNPKLKLIKYSTIVLILVSGNAYSEEFTQTLQQIKNINKNNFKDFNKEIISNNFKIKLVEEHPHCQENRRRKNRRKNKFRLSTPNNDLFENNDRRFCDTFL